MHNRVVTLKAAPIFTRNNHTKYSYVNSLHSEVGFLKAPHDPRGHKRVH